MSAPLPPLEIEELAARDVAEVAALDAAAFPSRGAPELPSPEARLREELARPWTRVWVARRAADPVVLGFVLAWFVVDELHVLNVATRADARRRGVGLALMRHAIAWAGAQRARHLVLEVRRSNTPAIRLYRAVGFFALGVRRDYYPDHEDAIEMMLALDPDTGAPVARPDEVHLEV